MKRIYISAVIAILLSVAPAKAQIVNYDFGGTVQNNDVVSWLDLYDFSFTSHNFGTARSMAMGNAFTALGADMVSASLNPAGIGMYVGGDFSFTPMIGVSKSKTMGGDPYYSSGDYEYFDDHTTRMAVPSFGVVFPLSKSTGNFTNINFGFSYNRIADFNQDRLMASYDNDAVNSVANYFRNFADIDNLQTDSSGKMDFGDDPYYWGPVLAYKSGLINKYDDGWFIDRIGANALVDQYSATQTRGSLGEWAFTVGFNIVDRLYLGVSLGIQSLNYKHNTYYGENYHYADDAPAVDGAGVPLDYQLHNVGYMQNTTISGSGHNFKLGLTARPFDWLRVGVAYHTPTYYSLDFTYMSDMNSDMQRVGNDPEGLGVPPGGFDYNEVYSPILEDYGSNAWEFRSPSRLLAGVAVTLGRRAILSADFERSWYQTIRLQDSPLGDELSVIYKQNYKSVFKGSNTLRLGGEFYLLPALALRAGYIWSGKTLRSDYEHAIFSRPIPTEQSFLTAGIGLHLSKTTTLDFAYQYGTTHYTSEQLFYITETVDGVTEEIFGSELFTTKTTRHNAVLTLSFRF